MTFELLELEGIHSSTSKEATFEETEITCFSLVMLVVCIQLI